VSTSEIVFQVVDVLNGNSIAYMLVGSIASNFYSVPRSTKDADIVIQTALADAAMLIADHCPSLKLDPQFSFETVTGTKKLLLHATAEDFSVELFGLSDDAYDCRRSAGPTHVYG
jgi:hypothetical protein